MNRLTAFITRRADLLAVVALVLLWLLFFWRLFTPIAADQASLKQGDFSGQFVTFAAYQYDRLSRGEVPLWNPYNNGGFPFLADTQSAVFYPPRLLTIALSSLSGGWTYHALELEMTVHVLAFTLMFYAYVRRLAGSAFGAFIAALVAGYGGYLSGYPPLQLALLEAAVWMPLALLGILEATRTDPAGRGRLRWHWLLVTGLALGISWLAGHPQTSFFLTYLLVAYYGYRLWQRPRTAPRTSWREHPIAQFLFGCAAFGLLAFALAAVQLLPGVEYLLHTTRTDFGYDAKGNGFPLQDIVQFIIPGVVSLYSPLWVGITGLALAFIALWRRLPQARFWGIVALIALLWSFGANSALFPALYNLLPGLRFFRGQERAAYLVVNSLAIMAGIGAAWLVRWQPATAYLSAMRLRLALNRALWLALAFAAFVFVTWVGNPAAYGALVSAVALTLIVTALLYLIVSAAIVREQRHLIWALALVLVFELFTVNLDASAVYDPIPPTEQISFTPPPLVAQVLADTDTPFLVDGARGLTDNYGSLYRVADIHGISPLFLDGMHNLIETTLPDPVTWALLGVRYVFTDWQELPVPSSIIGTGEDRHGALNLHRLANPRPFAAVLYRTVTVPTDAAAYDLLRDPAFPYDRTVILDRDTGINDTAAPVLTPARVASFTPEKIIIHAPAVTEGILTLALPHYPGWIATINQQQVEILRAYGGLSAIRLPQGDHLIELTYNPLTYRVGASLSLFTWLGAGILGGILLYRSRRAGK
jgi:hypothetical protein